jgi:hypothetical protein
MWLLNENDIIHIYSHELITVVCSNADLTFRNLLYTTVGSSDETSDHNKDVMYSQLQNGFILWLWVIPIKHKSIAKT